MGQPAARQAGKLKAKRANKINNPCRWLSSSAFGLIVVIQSGARKTNIPEPLCAALEMLNHLKKSPAGWLNRVGGWLQYASPCYLEPVHFPKIRRSFPRNAVRNVQARFPRPVGRRLNRAGVAAAAGYCRSPCCGRHDGTPERGICDDDAVTAAVQHG